MTQRYMHLSPPVCGYHPAKGDRFGDVLAMGSATADRATRAVHLRASTVDNLRLLNELDWLAKRSSRLDPPERKLAVRQGFEPWVQLLGRTTV
jgi:hypothetical protein